MGFRGVLFGSWRCSSILTAQVSMASWGAGGGRLGADLWDLMKRLRPPARQEVIETGAVRIEEERHGSQAFNFSRRTSTVSDSSSRPFVRASVPRSGSRSGTFLMTALPASKSTDLQLAAYTSSRHFFTAAAPEYARGSHWATGSASP